jgi:hypothetical protein
MSDTLRPRRHLHRGTVQAAAFWFDPALLGEGEARRRVLSGWTPGAAVLAVAEGYLLRLPRPRLVASDAAPGLPLTLEAGVLTSAPLSARERERLAPREGSAVLVRAGVARVYALAGAPGVDMAAWLDVTEWRVLSVKGLGAPPPPVVTLEPVAAPTRAAFGAKVPSLAPEAQVMLARMRGQEPPPGLVAAPPRPGLMARLRAALAGRAGQGGSAGARLGLMARLRAALRSQGTGSAARPGLMSRLRAAMRAQGTAPGTASEARPGLMSRLRAAMRSQGPATSTASASRPGLLARLRSAFSPRADSGTGRPVRDAPRPGGPTALESWLSRWLGRGGARPSLPARTSGRTDTGPSLLSRLLSALFGSSGASEGGAPSASPSGSAGTAPPQAPAKPPGPGLLSRLSELLLRNPLFRQLLGQRKAEYVRRLFDMFEEGNLDEALRYAIPLDSGAMTEDARVALGLPGPREKLTIQTGRGGAASVFGGGEEIYRALRGRYRDAFQRLEREGRIDEAAFVLAELLGAHEEAVSFLERHGRFKLAAELAEGRNLAPGLVVRQWFLAKDLARASAIARRTGAFADAVVRLQGTHPQEARELRWLWAETLAESGDWARAVQAVWPLHDDPKVLERTREWVARGVECGGASGARLLALWATALPGGLEAARAPLRALLDDDAPERAAERFAFALTLAGERASPGRTALVVPTVRALVRDLSAHRGRATVDFITRLLNDAPDGTLRADLPPLAGRTHRPWREDPTVSELRATARVSDEGAFPLHDAVALPDGRVLLALGEAGARLLAADGRTLAHFDVPAFALVPSLHGDRALALAPRGEVRRLSRLDLVRRRASAWCDARLDAWAPTYDGSVWFAAAERTVMMVDALAPELRALWRVTDVPGVAALAADAGRLSFLTHELERWVYDLAQGPTLRVRTSLLSQTEPFQLYALRSASLTPDGEVAAELAVPVRASSPRGDIPAGVFTAEARTLWLKPHGSRAAAQVEPTGPRREAVLLGEQGRVELLRLGESWEVRHVTPQGLGRVLFTFLGDTPPRVRFSPASLLAFDARGRLLWVDLDEGTVRSVSVT